MARQKTRPTESVLKRKLNPLRKDHRKPPPVYYDSHWIRVDNGGRLADPITNEQRAIRADSDGRVIGMAVDQVVMAGFAAYHIGLKAEVPGEE